jgi:hypothetical protein
MKQQVSALCALAFWLVPPLQAQNLVTNFEDVTFWTGTGSNRAALVLDFDTGSDRVSVAWGYRWDGLAVMEDMLFALAGSITGSGQPPAPTPGSDARLAANLVYYEGSGFFLNYLTFDSRGLGALWPDSQMRIENDYSATGTYPAVYLQPGNGTWTAQPFDYSVDHGTPTLALQNGGWFGIVQSSGEETYEFAAPYAAPAATPIPIPVPATVVQKTVTGASVNLMSSVGCYYQMQAKNALASSVWTNVGTAVAGHGQMIELFDPSAVSLSHRFYRVFITR